MDAEIVAHLEAEKLSFGGSLEQHELEVLVVGIRRERRSSRREACIRVLGHPIADSLAL